MGEFKPYGQIQLLSYRVNTPSPQEMMMYFNIRSRLKFSVVL